MAFVPIEILHRAAAVLAAAIMTRLWAAALAGSVSAEPQCVSLMVGDLRIFKPLPIDLKCPSDSNGVLEATTVGCEPGVKKRLRMRITYQNNVATMVWTGTSKIGEPFKSTNVIDLKTEKIVNTLEYGKVLAEQSD